MDSPAVWRTLSAMAPQNRQTHSTSPPRSRTALIDALLTEREHTGESYAALAARSGIPVGTLASRNHHRRRRSASSAFVEVIAQESGVALASAMHVSPPMEVVVLGPSLQRRSVVVPRDFDAAELAQLVRILEESC